MLGHATKPGGTNLRQAPLAPPLPPTFARAPHPPPVVTAQDMRRMDLWAMQEFQLPLPIMLENAGRHLASLALQRFNLTPQDPILVLAGKGANGAGVLTAGRHLAHRGYTVTAVTTEPAPRLAEETRRALTRLRREGGTAPTRTPQQPLPKASIILDGVIGYSLGDNPKGSAAQVIESANQSDAHRLALDVPSGLHPDSGQAKEPTFRAHATLALAMPKRGTLDPLAKPYVGELYLADIGFPRVLYQDHDTTPEAVFGDAEIVRLG